MAERALEIEVRKKVAVTNGERADASGDGPVSDRGVIQRRACALIDLARLGLLYECKMPIKAVIVSGPYVTTWRSTRDVAPGG